jgi:hypothetical protein
MTHDPHQEFQELCALSTTGELTAEEWGRFTEHLTHCDECQETKQQYERVVATAIPALASESGGDEATECAPGSWSLEEAENTLMESLRSEPAPSGGRSKSPSISPGWKHARRYAVAALVLAACGLVAYRAGSHQGYRPDASAARPVSPATNTPPRLDRPGIAGAVAEKEKPSGEDDKIAALQNQARQNQEESIRLKGQLGQLERELAERNADLDRSVQERAELSRQVGEAQANEQGLEARLSIIGNQTSQDTLQSLALKAQVGDLNSAIADKDKTIAQNRELLDRDRDIRNLISARNLYIAEIYDVGQSGDTENPFGRVFYTKDKSLIFYGYDLDQQPGIKKAGAFQAWGGRGADRQHAVSLGLLFKDDANQKRWVLKFNDAKTISQIDAVFVTVEPEGGSAKPSGKPLLFTYLRLDPNHP